jgi:hypothetical protein
MSHKKKQYKRWMSMTEFQFLPFRKIKLPENGQLCTSMKNAWE